jgi:DNA repair protein RadC
MKVKIPKISSSIAGPGNIAEIFRAVLNAESDCDKDKEHFWIVGTTTRNNIKYIELVALGTLNQALVHPREVFRMAILQASSSIITVHNHPSGDPSPSEEDIKLTKRLCEAGKILGIETLDHVIVGTNSYQSLKEMGYIY